MAADYPEFTMPAEPTTGPPLPLADAVAGSSVDLKGTPFYGGTPGVQAPVQSDVSSGPSADPHGVWGSIGHGFKTMASHPMFLPMLIGMGLSAASAPKGRKGQAMSNNIMPMMMMMMAKGGMGGGQMAPVAEQAPMGNPSSYGNIY